MKYLKKFEMFKDNIIIGIDIDGTINNFSEGFDIVYKRYFPDKELIINDDWYWYQKLDYNGENPNKWFREKKSETFEYSKPYPGAVVTINNIYDFIKSQDYTMNLVTCQPKEDAKEAAKLWIEKYGFNFDDIIFVDASKDKWKYVDIMVDDGPKVIGNKPLSKVSIKIDQLWNTEYDGDINLQNIKGLTIDVIKNAIDKLEKLNRS